MIVKDIKKIAVQKGISPQKMKKAEMIRAIQVQEGNFPCYETAKDYCDRQDCLWQEDCLKH
jgi:hypothetical protein